MNNERNINWQKIELPTTNERNEYVAIVMSRELLRFCKENDLPFDSADDLVHREDLTDFQFGWLIGYCRIWEGLIE
jgi:hypothetical protein